MVNIIVMIVISFCISIITCTVFYCILKKKYDEDINWLFNEICDNHTMIHKLYDKYQDHIADYHIS